MPPDLLFLILTLLTTYVAATSTTLLANLETKTLDIISTVTLSWTGIVTDDEDWIGVFSPAESEETLFKFRVSKLSSHYLAFDIANNRDSYCFGYFRKGKMLARSNVVTSNHHYPSQGHIALTDGGVRIMWTDSNWINPILRLSENGGRVMELYAESYTYGTDDMLLCAVNGTSPAIEMFRDPGVLHFVDLGSLKSGENYSYSFGSKEEGFSDTFTFIGPTTEGEVSIILMADMGTSLCIDETGGWCARGSRCVLGFLENMLDEDPRAFDLIIHNGDLSYAVGRAYRWDMWMNEIQSVATRVPYMVTIGNHEYDYEGQAFHANWTNYYNDSDGECGVPTKNRFLMPWVDDAQWYSFDIGYVHNIVLSFEYNFTRYSEQYKWLLQELRNIDRNKTPWVVLSVHRPFYSSGLSDEDFEFARHVREEMEEQIFGIVDVVFAGHYHQYERTCQVFNEKCTEGAPVHIVVGTAGVEIEDDWMEKPNWSISRIARYGFGKLTANKNSLKFQFIDCEEGTVQDEFSLTK